jgi:AcrR family transcriptional regulator
MRDVGAASGILAGSLYHHFDSKEAIAVELVEGYYADLVAAVRRSGTVDTDALTALRLFTTEIAELSFRHQAALQIRMFDAPSTASPSLKTVIHAAPASLNRRWRTLISAAVADGAVSPEVDPLLGTVWTPLLPSPSGPVRGFRALRPRHARTHSGRRRPPIAPRSTFVLVSEG